VAGGGGGGGAGSPFASNRRFVMAAEGGRDTEWGAKIQIERQRATRPVPADVSDRFGGPTGQEKGGEGKKHGREKGGGRKRMDSGRWFRARRKSPGSDKPRKGKGRGRKGVTKRKKSETRRSLGFLA